MLKRYEFKSFQHKITLTNMFYDIIKLPILRKVNLQLDTFIEKTFDQCLTTIYYVAKFAYTQYFWTRYFVM